MRALAPVAVAVALFFAAGCASRDPFAGEPRALAVVTLPGHAAAATAPLARTHGAWLVPFRDGNRLYARRIADGGELDERALGEGELVGVAGLDDGFAVAVRQPGGVAVHFLGASGPADRVAVVALAGAPLPYLASDGTRVIVAATTGGEIAIDTPRPLYATLAIVSPAAAPMTIDLGQVPAPPSLWGDRAGFVVAGKQLLDGTGAMATAPGEQITAARLFRRAAAEPHPARDDVSLDGKRWLALDGLAACATSSGADTLVQLDSRELVRVGRDLTLRARLPLPAAGRLLGAGDDVLVWGRDENGSAFAGLDPATAAVRGAPIEIVGADPGSISVAPGAADVLFAWNDSAHGDPVVKTARVIP